MSRRQSNVIIRLKMESFRRYGGRCAYMMFSDSAFMPFAPESRVEPLAHVLARDYSVDVYTGCMCMSPWPEDIHTMPPEMLDATTVYNRLCQTYKHVGILGMGSGGYFALLFAQMMGVDHLVLVAPVLDPSKLPPHPTKEWNHQLTYFGSQERMQKITELHLQDKSHHRPRRIAIVTGDKDVDVPLEVRLPSWLHPNCEFSVQDADDASLRIKLPCTVLMHIAKCMTECAVPCVEKDEL